MRRKRGRDWEYNNPAAAVENGRRPQSPTRAAQEKKTCVVAMGLAPECSVLDLKSRFEFYGPVSRIRIDPDSVGYITFRSNDSAAAAVAASRDPDSAITIHSRAVQVMLATDPLAKWREGVASVKDKVSALSTSSASSKLLRSGLPLSRHGRDNKLASAVVNPRKGSEESASERPFKGRGIIAYDDIL
ncbi:hypothetical protein MLD38_027365 [Melastoma candidum]|uniref:Uncharacterized protein n=1 Tax=Melastoma candidum TaxID=119954 RepID=A0ACB9P499_9MYRT|nr:hypothetical protein MLD38_027365 [Melastoma candidum]